MSGTQRTTGLALRILILSSVLFGACSDSGTSERALAAREIRQLDIQQLGGSTMGTGWSIQWISELTSVDIEPDIQRELVRINALMSTWDPDSELSQFNSSVSTDPTELHADTLAVIDAALPISRLTAGRYDIALKPLIDLWGFSKNTATQAPDENAIASAQRLSGYRQLVRIGNTIRKRRPEVAIDVSSLAKGYAVDQLGRMLEQRGISRYLVDIGGELRGRGLRADGYPWRIGIESPDGDVPQLLALLDSQIASSGSYRNYRVEDGKRISHIIDGATGRPIEHDLVSVSVVHRSTMLADAWATALLVVGEVQAQKLIDEQGLAAQLTVYRDGQFERTSSDEFYKLLVTE
ncbi:MAG: FAD:protein FMN transferase [Granulosicoccus sp.]